MKLTRSNNAMIGGVAGGIAKALGIDPTIIRIAFVLVALFAGGGILLYVILWVVIPKEGTTETIAEEGLNKAKEWYDEHKGGNAA